MPSTVIDPQILSTLFATFAMVLLAEFGINGMLLRMLFTERAERREALLHLEYQVKLISLKNERYSEVEVANALKSVVTANPFSAYEVSLFDRVADQGLATLARTELIECIRALDRERLMLTHILSAPIPTLPTPTQIEERRRNQARLEDFEKLLKNFNMRLREIDFVTEFSEAM